MNSRSILFLLTITLSSLPGISYAGVSSESGFIEAGVNFEKHPYRSNVFRYLKKDLNLGDYDQIMIAPVEVWIHPDSPYKGVQANNIKAISDHLRRIMVSTLDKDYPVVRRAGKKTIAVRLAVTGVKLHKKKRNFISYMPIGMADAAIKEDMLSSTTLSNAVIEADLIDSQTGERIAALIDRNMAADLWGDSHKWDEIDEVFEFYAKRFKKHLDASR